MGTKSESSSTGLRALGAGAFLCAAALIAGAGGVAIAMPSAIPDSSDGEVHVCYNGKQSRNKDGGAILRIYDGDKNTKQCLPKDTSATLPTRTKLLNGETGLIFGTQPVGAAFADVPGYAINLPSAGTWLLSLDIRGRISGTAAGAVSCGIVTQLASPSAVISGLRGAVYMTNPTGTGTGQVDNASFTELVTVTAPTLIKVQAKSEGASCGNSDENIFTDNSGASTIAAVRIAS